MIKRAVDLSVAIPALIVLAPVFALLAILIRLDSPGPALFRQVRVGRNSRPFRIHKFRTMQLDSVAAGLQVTVGEDRRTTRVGRYLRRFKVDELPQLIDVVFGNMSLVGPRPEVPQYVGMWPADARKIILSVRPGMTDPVSLTLFNEAEILARSERPEEAYVNELLPLKVSGYVEYVRTRSTMGDVSLLIRTAFRTLKA